MSFLLHGFDERVAIASAPIEWTQSGRTQAVPDVVARVAERRAREYATGRMLARELLRNLGAPHLVVTRAADRSPRWPSGFVGSIAHTERRCIVAVARARDFAGLGIDVEPALDLEADLFEAIATQGELLALAHVPSRERGRAVRRLFTAKEAAYKCVHPSWGVFLDFHDIEVEFSTAGDRFTVTVTHLLHRELELEGRFAEHDGCFHALVALPARERVSSH